MAITRKGAWFLPGDAYTPVLRGTNGQSVASDSDNLGWACFAWKYALLKNGYRGEMILDSPVLGDAARTQIEKFQGDHNLKFDGSIGPITGERLLRIYFQEAEQRTFELPAGTLWQIGAQESNFDTGAIGFIDPGDRGPVQKHIFPGGVSLSQAIRPAYSIEILRSQIERVRNLFDLETAVVSWSVGEGGAEWWFKNGKPTSGGQDIFGFDVGARAWKYLQDVHSHTLPSDYFDV